MSAVWVPPGRQTFFGQDGKALSLGTVELYIPNTFTAKLSWADEAQTTSNPNPILLDASGSAPIWGSGLYRMIAKDQFGVQTFDEVTGFIASGGGGGGDVFGPGASIPGNFAVWASIDGTQIADGGHVGTLAHLSTVDDSNWGAAPLSLVHGGTGGTDAPTARAALGLGDLAVLDTITAALVSDFDTAVEADLDAMLVAGSGISITHTGHTFVFTNTGGGGGGGITGPVSSLNGELPAFQGTSGAAVTNTGCVPSANGFSLIAAANYAAMRTALGLGTSAVVDTGTSGAKVPLLSTANTWTLAQTFTVAPVFSAQANTRTALGLGALAVLSTITASLISDPTNVKSIESLEVAASDESTALTTGAAKVTFFMPYDFTFTEVFTGNSTASSVGAVQTDVQKNGATLFSTKPSIGSAQNTSLSGAGSVAAVLSVTTAVKGDKMTVDISTAGSGAKGLKVVLVGHRT